MLSDLETLTLQVETLFSQDAAQRLLYVNEPDKPEAPRFFLGRTREGNICRFRHDLPKTLRKELEALADSEPLDQNLHAPPLHAKTYQDMLAEHNAVQKVWSGPAYCFPEKILWPAGVVQITDANVELLEDNWLRAVLEDKKPCMATVVENRAVSVCHSSRTSPAAAEAGLETLPDFRGRGYAAIVVGGWGAAVREMGRIPLYSTSWQNAASQRVAMKSGLHLYAVDFHIT